MKGSDQFKKTIEDFLTKQANEDSAFAEKFKNPKKKIDDCITYILNTVKSSGKQGFADDEIYGMAMHYYDEENIKVGSKISSGNVVINHKIELTPEEIAQAHVKAKQSLIDKEIDKEKERLTKEALSDFKVELTPEEIEAAQNKARQEAIDKAVADKKDKLIKKAAKAKPAPSSDIQGSLF